MINKLRKQTRGFTIIEVLIVLAIAGLILLIVFLAVPALQRNSRNTSYRNEAAQLLAATSEWSNNSNGQVPAASVSSTPGSNAEAIFQLTKNKNITVFEVEAFSATAVAAGDTTFDRAVLRTGSKCNATGTDTDPAAGAARQIAIVYAIESATGTVTRQCTAS